MAWFAATDNVNVKSGDNTDTISVMETSSVSFEKLVLDATITVTEPTGGIELSNNAGETYYVVAGRTVKKTNPQNTGTWTVSFDWGSNDDKAVFLASKPVSNYVCYADVEGKENAVLLESDNASDATTGNKKTVTITIDKDTGAISLTGNNGYFAVRAEDVTIGDSGKTAEAAHDGAEGHLATDYLSVTGRE